MSKLAEKVKVMRPNIRDSSLTMYLANLKKYNQEKGEEDPENIQTLRDSKFMDKFFEKRKNNTVKNYLASFVVLSMTNGKMAKTTEKLRKMMEDKAEVILEHAKSQEKSEAQMKNWVPLEQLQKIVENYLTQINKKKLFDKSNIFNEDGERKVFSKDDKCLIQKYLVGSLFVADPINNPPLRADYNMKIVTQEQYEDLEGQDLKKNYLVIRSRNRKYFSLGDYKTEGKYGLKKIKLGSKLNSVMNKVLPTIDSDNLITDTNNNGISPSGLSKLVVKTFEPTGKKVGINMLRHIVITTLYPPNLSEKSKTADLMGHSVAQSELYSKKE